MAFKCTKTCRNAEIGGDDPLFDALAEIGRLRKRLELPRKGDTDENVRLRSALRDLLDAYIADVNPSDRNETAIEHARRHL